MANKGQALVEYGLAISTIMSVSIVGLLLLSSKINVILSNMVPQYSSRQAAYATNIPNLPVSLSVKQVVLPQGTALTDTQVKFTQQFSETTISPQDTQSSIQVSGANGATRQLATILMAETQQLLESGDISSSQYQLLRGLANQGFILADAQKLLEDAIGNNQSEVIYQGKTYSILQFASMFGINPPPNTQWDLSPQYGAPLIKPFMEQYQTVLESDVFQTPAIEKTVSSLSYQIAAIGDALEWNLYKLASETQSPVPLNTMNSSLAETFLLDMEGAKMENSNASEKTQQNSVGICNAGSGNSNGANCT